MNIQFPNNFINFENLVNKEFSLKTIKEELELTTKDKKFPSSLLGSPEDHFKLKKNIKINNVRSYPLNLSPSTISGFNTCPKASEMCKKYCLHFSGIKFQFDNKQIARIKRTKAFYENRFWFLRLLKYEIDKAIKKAKKDNIEIGFRLNTTSDIFWESVRFDSGISVIEYIINSGGYVYDYTKCLNRVNKKTFPKQYHLTFSYSGDNLNDCIKAYESGLNIAIPFNSGEITKLNKPEFFKLGKHKVSVINGDLTDFRISDPKGVIVGLDYKFNKELNGSYKHQLNEAIESGFCIDVKNDSRCIGVQK